MRISISVPSQVNELLTKEKNKSKALWSAYLKDKGLILETKTTVKKDEREPSEVFN